MSIDVGSSFPTISGIVDLEGKPAEVDHDGRVTMVEFWATWCSKSQEPMQQTQQMMKENPSWKDKVRVVAVSLDSGVDAPKDRVESAEWDKLEHYQRGGKYFSEWNFRGMPHVAVIDKKGKSVSKGNPATLDVERTIKELVSA